MRRALFIIWLILVAGLIYGVSERRTVVLDLMSLADPPALLDVENLEDGVDWWDDYYTVEWLDERTVAIGEPRFVQRNFAYLILGDSRAVLFDTGPGVRSALHRLVAELTSLPVVAAPSHLHYDHIGNLVHFDEIALMDVAGVRDQLTDGVLVPGREQFLGFVEGYAAPRLRPTEWWAPGDTVELGGRSLRVLHTPGHTPESISLLDDETGWLFTGDFLYVGPLFAFVPGSSLEDYRAGVKEVLGAIPDGIRSVGGHGRQTSALAPILGRRDLLDLDSVLEEIEDGIVDGRGLFPRVYDVNSSIELWTDPLD
jgi:glyoxylase-like metal-dependent hydrolase (beta-lactamase superfamily II)